MRLEPATASGRSVPSLMCGSATDADWIVTWVRPVMLSWIAFATVL